MIQKLDTWHKTKLGLLIFGLVELGLAYGFVSLAIDRGSLFYYLLVLIFLVGVLQNVTKLIGTYFNNAKPKKRH